MVGHLWLLSLIRMLDSCNEHRIVLNLIETWRVTLGIKGLAGHTLPQYTICADHVQVT